MDLKMYIQKRNKHYIQNQITHLFHAIVSYVSLAHIFYILSIISWPLIWMTTSIALQLSLTCKVCPRGSSGRGGRFLRLARKDICMPRTGKLLNILNIKHVDRFPRDYIVKQITVFQRKSHVHKKSSLYYCPQQLCQTKCWLSKS